MFPSLSATVIPHAQEIKFRRGDSFAIDVQVQDDQDPPSNVDIARAVLRFGAKVGFGRYQVNSQINVENEGIQILKQSYASAEIEMIDETNGQARIHIKKSNTVDHPTVPMIWDLELTLPTSHLAGQPGTVTVQPGDSTVLGVGTDFVAAGVELGDIIHVEGRYVMVLDVTGPYSMTVDFTGWNGDANLPYNLYTGASRVIAGGPWTCLGDVVI